jgi:peptidyl-prolyl cis-trans isomerase C
MAIRFLFGALLVAFGTAVGATASGAAGMAAEAEPAEAAVAAVVNGTAIPRRRVEALYDAVAQRHGVPLSVAYDALLDRIIREELVQAEVAKVDLRADPEVERRLAAVEEQILRDIFLTRQAEKAVTDTMVREQYEGVAETRETVHLRHILLADEEAARQALARLEDGADFSALAREVSQDPSASAGGDLGYLAADDMPPSLAKVAFALEPGQVAKTPVRTPFGWHVVTVEDRRIDAPPTLDAVRTEIRAVLLQREATRYVDALEAAATIQRYDLDGKPVGTP